MYLHSDPEKVVAVHCNHGKGRTGTIICCFLLYCNMFKNATLAMDYYAKKRFETNGSDIEGFGVTQPCQIQYIHYF
jgi:phosphatidylinositol-3,4,5-trisphosphate 3-phosphatase/dual-specificity protein phosphatase PTEN